MAFDHAYMAVSLANLTGLPVRVYRRGVYETTHGSTAFSPDPAGFVQAELLLHTESVAYLVTEQFLYYGLFRAAEADVAFLIGPTMQMRPDKQTLRLLLTGMGEPASRMTELMNYLGALPVYPLQSFLQILCTLDYFINGNKTTAAALMLPGAGGMEAPESALPEVRNVPVDAGAYEHNTYELEKRMLSLVEAGRTEALRALFSEPPSGRSGKLAGDEMRQQKNLFICSTTLVTRAAIRGGLPQETAFSLSDIYIQKVEMLERPTDVVRLMQQMVFDFTDRVAREQVGQSRSRLVQQVRHYVLDHITERLTGDVIAAALSINRTYLSERFFALTGTRVHDFIIQMKVAEAKRLLDVTDKSLVEISAQLSFSSQSYFCSTFKRVTGTTPAAYRRRGGVK